MNNCHRKALIHNNCSNVYSSLFSTSNAHSGDNPATTLSGSRHRIHPQSAFSWQKTQTQAALSGRSNPARLTAYPRSLSWLRPRYPRLSPPGLESGFQWGNIGCCLSARGTRHSSSQRRPPRRSGGRPTGKPILGLWPRPPSRPTQAPRSHWSARPGGHATPTPAP